MKKFSGFPARMEFTPLPNIFFSSLLPQITDIGELKTTLHMLAMLYRKRGYPRFVTLNELAAGMTYDQGIAETLIGVLALAGKTPPPYVLVPIEKVTRKSIERSYKRVFRKDPEGKLKDAIARLKAKGIIAEAH